jgi:hypothetical protein
VNGNGAGSYVRAWARVWGLFDSAGANSHVTWIWSPNTPYGGSTGLSGLWPGSKMVNMVALDGYNCQRTNTVDSRKQVSDELAGCFKFRSLISLDAFSLCLFVCCFSTGGTTRGGAWESFYNIFAPGVAEVRSLPGAGSLPFIIAETASTEVGGDKAQWVSE